MSDPRTYFAHWTHEDGSEAWTCTVNGAPLMATTDDEQRARDCYRQYRERTLANRRRGYFKNDDLPENPPVWTDGDHFEYPA